MSFKSHYIFKNIIVEGATSEVTLFLSNLIAGGLLGFFIYTLFFKDFSFTSTSALFIVPGIFIGLYSYVKSKIVELKRPNAQKNKHSKNIL